MFPKALINFLLVLDFTFITQPTEPGTRLFLRCVIACDAARQYVVWLGVYFHMPLSSSSLILLVAMVKLTLLPIVEVIRWIMETHQPITDTAVDRCIFYQAQRCPCMYSGHTEKHVQNICCCFLFFSFYRAAA